MITYIKCNYNDNISEVSKCKDNKNNDPTESKMMIQKKEEEQKLTIIDQEEFFQSLYSQF